jgi:PleD family two-component response regulator
MPKYASTRILIADDQGSMLQLLRAGLRRIGCTNVVGCVDGEEALRQLMADQIDLVISDLNMPKVDGLALLAAVRCDARLLKTPFIMLTGRGDDKLIKQAVDLGINGYLIKPYSIDALKLRIETVIGPNE